MYSFLLDGRSYQSQEVQNFTTLARAGEKPGEPIFATGLAQGSFPELRF
jgi:hypothetical protein